MAHNNQQLFFSHNVEATLASGSRSVTNWILAEDNLNILRGYLRTIISSMQTTLETETDHDAMHNKLRMHLMHLAAVLNQANGQLQLNNEQSKVVGSIENLIEANTSKTARAA